MLTAVLPVIATMIAATLAALSAVGLTAEARLVRRSNRLLELANRMPARKVRRELQAAAAADAQRALTLRATGRAFGIGLGASLGSTVVALGIPLYVEHYPEQGAGWQGTAWGISLLLYTLGAIVGWTFVGALFWRRLHA